MMIMKLSKLNLLTAALLIIILALSACSGDDAPNNGDIAGQGSGNAGDTGSGSGSGSTEAYLAGAVEPRIGEITNPQTAYYRYNSNLYKMDINGSNVTQITELPTTDPIVFGDWIYYFVAEWTSGGKVAPNIRAIRTDGTDDMRLVEAPVRTDTEFRGHAVQGEWLYYGFGKDISAITTHIEREDREWRRIKQGIGDPFYIRAVDNGWLYYTTGGHGVAEPGIWRIRTDGTDEAKVADGQFDGDIFFDGDWIYAYRVYAFSSSDHGVYKIAKDGSSSELIQAHPEGDRDSQGLLVHGGYIYNVHSSFELTKTEARAGADAAVLDYDGEDVIFLLGASAEHLYYRVRSEIYRIAFDGSGRTKITDEIVPGQRVWPGRFILR